MTTFPRIPNDESLAAAREELTAPHGHDFWSLTDSTASGRTLDCWCPEGQPLPNCRNWVRHRDSERCFAARSDEARCGQLVFPNTPFCAFHLNRAWRALLAAVSVEAQTHAERVVEDLSRREREERERVLWNLNIEADLIWDASRAARRVGERVYFFKADHAVKIGRSIDPENRVKTLGSTKAPEGVNVRAGSLLGTIPGGCRVEGSLHRRFVAHRLVGEWFDYEPIAERVAELIANGAEVAA